MAQYENFTSLSAQDEQAFVVYERTGNEVATKSRNIGMIVSGVLLVLIVGMYFGIAPIHPAEVADEASTLQKAPAKPAAEVTPATK